MLLINYPRGNGGISDICQKFVRLPYTQTNYIVFPLLHTDD